MNDLMIARGHETPENHPLTTLNGFSTVSEVIFLLIAFVENYILSYAIIAYL